MRLSEQKRALATAVAAARAAGRVMRRNLRASKAINSQTQHDIKLELDVRCQRIIQQRLLRAFPGTALLGEEGVAGDPGSRLRWVVDPIDGTVNFTYGIPHSCVCIALQIAEQAKSRGKLVRKSHRAAGRASSGFRTLLGVVYDPFQDELWTALRGQPARLNGDVIHVSDRRGLGEALISLGFGNSP